MDSREVDIQLTKLDFAIRSTVRLLNLIRRSLSKRVRVWFISSSRTILLRCRFGVSIDDSAVLRRKRLSDFFVLIGHFLVLAAGYGEAAEQDGENNAEHLRHKVEDRVRHNVTLQVAFH